jgi:hypothetical protein
LKREQGRFDLMGVQIDLGIGKRPGQLFNAVGRALFGQIEGEKFRVVVCKTNDCLFPGSCLI